MDGTVLLLISYDYLQAPWYSGKKSSVSDHKLKPDLKSDLQTIFLSVKLIEMKTNLYKLVV